MTAVSDSTLAIDVISDVVCPWCFIGKRRLEAALAQLAAMEPGLKPRVSWQPFQLNPNLPREGVNRKSYLEAKFGGPESAAMSYERVRAAGATEGIAFAFDRILRQPNTQDAHRLIAWAHENGGEHGAEPLVERLFRAYFLEGRYVGDRDVLAAIAGEAGLSAGAARAMLEAEGNAGPVAAMERRARALGVTGVPFFIFSGRVAVSGAQEPAVLLDAIRQTRAEPGS